MPVQPQEASQSDTYTILRAHKYDPGTQATNQKRIIQVKDYDEIKDKRLDFIRSLLVSEGVFDSTDVGSPFCDQKGSELSDTTDLKVYFNVIGGNAPKDEENSTSAGHHLDVYYKKRKTRTELDDETKEFLKKQLDLNMKDQKLSEADLKRLQSTFDSSLWMAKAGEKQSHAADLSESEWSIITRTNCLLSGHKMVVYNKKTNNNETTKEMKVERTPYTAFRLKKRDFDPYDISASSKVAGVSSGTPTAPTTSTIAFRIPRFRVDDDSYVSVYETQNALQSSLARSAFSETSVEASGGGGFWGVSAAASAGFSTKDETNSVTAECQEEKMMNIAYKFPRVSVYLDPGSLEVTEECREDVAKVVNRKTLIAFSNKYGDIFAQRVQLGGALFASEYSKAVGEQTKEAKTKAMKASAAASFSSPWAQASANASTSNGSDSEKNNSTQHLENSMAWEAIGGDSLLCNNPPEWCATVGDFYNWRAIEQSEVIPLYKMLSLFDGFDGIEHRFETSAKDQYEASQWVRYEFDLFEKDTQNPLAVYQGDDSLWKHLNTKFSELPSGGIPSLDKYKQDTLARVAHSESTIRYDKTSGGSARWAMRHHLYRGQDRSRIPSASVSGLQNVDITYDKFFAALTESCPGYHDDIYLTQSYWDSARNFCLEPYGSDQIPIEEGTNVLIKANFDARYLAKTESGLLTARKWDISKENEFLVCTVRNIKVETE